MVEQEKSRVPQSRPNEILEALQHKWNFGLSQVSTIPSQSIPTNLDGKKLLGTVLFLENAATGDAARFSTPANTNAALNIYTFRPCGRNRTLLIMSRCKML